MHSARFARSGLAPPRSGAIPWRGGRAGGRAGAVGPCPVAAREMRGGAEKRERGRGVGGRGIEGASATQNSAVWVRSPARWQAGSDPKPRRLGSPGQDQAPRQQPNFGCAQDPTGGHHATQNRQFLGRGRHIAPTQRSPGRALAAARRPPARLPPENRPAGGTRCRSGGPHHPKSRRGPGHPHRADRHPRPAWAALRRSEHPQGWP